MARIVMSIIWARYVVNAGRGGIRTGLLDVEADETWTKLDVGGKEEGLHLWAWVNKVVIQ